MAWFNPNITFSEESEQFIGRKPLISSLEKELINISPQPRLCYSGLLRSGKSSVFKSVHDRICRRFAGGSTPVMPVIMDLMKVDPGHLFQEMILSTTNLKHVRLLSGKIAPGEITQARSGFLEQANRCEAYELADLAESWIDWWNSHGVRLLYILDEFQNFHEIVDSERFLEILSKEPVGLVLVGRTTLRSELSLFHDEASHAPRMCSNFTQRAFLGFDDDDMQHYWAYMGNHLNYLPSSVMQDQIIWFTGRSPLLLAFYGQHIENLLEHGRFEDLDPACVKNWEILAYNSYYCDCRIQLQCDELLEDISGVISGSKVPHEKLELLQAMGYLHSDNRYQHKSAGWYAISKEFTRRLREDPTKDIDIKIHFAEKLLARMLASELENIYPPLRYAKNRKEWNEAIKEMPVSSDCWKKPGIHDIRLYSGSHTDAWRRARSRRVDSAFTLFTRFCIVLSYFDPNLHKYFTDEDTSVWTGRFHKIYNLRNFLDHPDPHSIRLSEDEKELMESAAAQTKKVIDCLKEQFALEGDTAYV